jgi:hypothetical protein
LSGADPLAGGADATVVDRSTVFPLVESEVTSPELTWRGASAAHAAMKPAAHNAPTTGTLKRFMKRSET